MTTFAVLFLFPFNIFCLENYEKLLEDARKSWTDGRPQDAIEAYKYIIYVSTGPGDISAVTRELAVLLNESAQNALAKIYIEKAQVAAKDDPWLEFEKGWALLSLKKYTEAKASFENVPTMTADPDLIYNSRFMQAMTEMELAGPLKAIENFQTVYQKYPYLLSASSYMIARCYDEIKKRSHAINFLKETLQYDETGIQALITLARTYEDVDYYIPAWQAYYTLSELDPGNKIFEEKKNKFSKYLKGNPDNLLYWTRLGWPLHAEPLKIKGVNKIKVGLFTDGKGERASLTRFFFITNSDFEIIDSKLGKTYAGKKNSQYEVAYVEKNRIFEIKDNSASKIYTTRQNFLIKPAFENGVLLIKSPEIKVSVKGVDRSDREISNELAVKVSTEGMKLSNLTYIEHILPSAVSAINAPKENQEFLKALAVIVRTRLMKYKNYPFFTDYDICDSKACVEFKGLQYESANALKAAEATGTEMLYKGDTLAEPSWHASCGGETRRGADDGSTKPKRADPFSLNKWFMSAPSQKLYCLPEDSTLFSSVIWMQMLDPYWIEERINSEYGAGKIKNIQVLARDDFGEVESLLIKGSANEITIEDKTQISRILSGGTMRSMVFNIRPLMKGGSPQYFLLRGIGTGDLRDFCLAGAHSMAKNLGYKYEMILKHYLPDLAVKDSSRPAPRKKK